MAKKLHKIRLDEVSAVDKAANEDSVIVLRKRDGSGEQVVDLGWNPAAKKSFLQKLGPNFQPEIFDGERQEDDPGDPPGHFRPERYAGTSLPKPKRPGKIKKPKNTPAAMFNSLVPARTLTAGDLYKRMQKVAKERQKEGETPEQAFARFMTEDPEGRELYEAYRSADPDEPEDADDDVSGIVETSKAYDELMAKAAKIAKREGLTVAQGFEKAYKANPELAAADRAHNRTRVGNTVHGMTPARSLGSAQGARSPKPAALASLAAEDATPASAYNRLTALAQKYAAEHGVTEEVAFATIAQQHPDLFALGKRYTVPVTEATAVAKAVETTPSLDALNSLRDEILQKNVGLTPEQAFERAMAHPRGRALYQRYRAELLG